MNDPTMNGWMSTTDEFFDLIEARVVKLEEIVAARFPRRIVLTWLLGREIRASVKGFDGDFADRRGNAVSYEWGDHDRRRKPSERDVATPRKPRPRSRMTTTRHLTSGFDSMTLDPSPRLREMRTKLHRRNFYGKAGRLLSQAMTEAVRSTRTRS